jgi:hypothetical protein
MVLLQVALLVVLGINIFVWFFSAGCDILSCFSCGVASWVVSFWTKLSCKLGRLDEVGSVKFIGAGSSVQLLVVWLQCQVV